MKFPFLRPVLPKPERWMDLLELSYEKRYFSNFGPLATKLETSLAEAYLAQNYSAIGVTSNTLGQMAVLQALDVRGKYVILPDFTFAGTLQAVLGAGGKPVICDVSPETGELCPDSLRQCLSKYDDVAVVIYVRCFGFVNDITGVKEICKSAGVQLMVDAAASLADPTDQQFGSDDGEIEVFSLHATKVFAIGEGGMIAVPDHLKDKIRRAVNFGINPDRTYGDGTNAKIDEFRSAIGLSMLNLIPELIEHRQQHAENYIELINSIPNVEMFEMPERASWSCFPILLPVGSREKSVAVFSDHGIEVKKYYWPGLMNAYRGSSLLETIGVPVSEEVQDKVLCLPVYSEPSSDYWPSLKTAAKNALKLLA